MSKHVVKYDHLDGIKSASRNFTLWCGRRLKPFDPYYVDAQHLALSIGGSGQPCKNCIKAIIKELEKEL